MTKLTQTEPLAVATFEKVSFEEFLKDAYRISNTNLEPDNDEVKWLRKQYDDIKFPTRATSGSAGYDFYCPYETEIMENFDTLICTGIRVKLEPGWMLALFPRSGLGFKYGVRLKNTVGIIDSDYYNATNEGHIMAKLAADEYTLIHQGDRFMQGILLPCGITTNDSVIKENRVGGFGSTGN